MQLWACTESRSPTIIGVDFTQTWNLAQTLHGQDFLLVCLPKKAQITIKLTFATVQRKLCIHIITYLWVRSEILNKAVVRWVIFFIHGPMNSGTITQGYIPAVKIHLNR